MNEIGKEHKSIANINNLLNFIIMNCISYCNTHSIYKKTIATVLCRANINC